ncbi:hypothetical protein [Rothia nasimurium]|uniref:hypothetical protein n=1 Tax=Rothia nasimurium TaxID=85336 RepID=UPI002DD6A7BD|nr:hypothetical protein [Rothia nasimurium]
MSAPYHFIPYPSEPGLHPALAGILTVPVSLERAGEPSLLVYLQGEVEQDPNQPPGQGKITVTYRPDTVAGVQVSALYRDGRGEYEDAGTWQITASSAPLLGGEGLPVLIEASPGTFQPVVTGDELTEELELLTGFCRGVRALINRELGNQPYPATWPRLTPGVVTCCSNLPYLISATQATSEVDVTLALPTSPLRWWGFVPVRPSDDTVRGLAATASRARPEGLWYAGFYRDYSQAQQGYQPATLRCVASTDTDCWALKLSWLNSMTLYVQRSGNWDIVYGSPLVGAQTNLPFTRGKYEVADVRAASALEPLVRAIHRDLYEEPGLPPVTQWRIGPHSETVHLALANDWGEFFPLWYADEGKPAEDLKLAPSTRQLLGKWASLWEDLELDPEDLASPKIRAWRQLGERLCDTLTSELGAGYTVKLHLLSRTQPWSDLQDRA